MVKQLVAFLHQKASIVLELSNKSKKPISKKKPNQDPNPNEKTNNPNNQKANIQSKRKKPNPINQKKPIRS